MLLTLIVLNLLVTIITFFVRTFYMSLIDDVNQYCEKINNFYVVLLCSIPILNVYFLCCFICKIVIMSPDNLWKKDN